MSLSWLVYRLTGSSALLGVTAFCALIPQLVVGPLAGAWIDRQDKKKWLIGVQALLALRAFALAALTWTDLIGTGLIIGMSLVLGVLNSFDTPLRQSLINSFVGRPRICPTPWPSTRCSSTPAASSDRRWRTCLLGLTSGPCASPSTAAPLAR